MTDTPDAFKPTVQTVAAYAIRVEDDMGGRFYIYPSADREGSESSIHVAEFAYGSRQTYTVVPLVEQAEVERLRRALEAAYREGLSAGFASCSESLIEGEGDGCWLSSKARKALDPTS